MKDLSKRVLEDFSVILIGSIMVSLTIFISLPIPSEANLFILLLAIPIMILASIDLTMAYKVTEKPNEKL